MATSFGMMLNAAQSDLRDNIRDLARTSAWTLADLAREADMKYSLLTQGLSGNRWFTEDEVDAIAEALEVAVDELMGESVFKAEARGSKYDRPHHRFAAADVGSGHRRALCCECGTFRRYGSADVDPLAVRISDFKPEDPLGRRMVATMKCRTCERPTLHAELRGEGQYRDISEEVDRAPTREQEARRRRDEFIDRLAGFNVAVRFDTQSKKQRAKGYVASYEYDESKSQWLIEVDPNIPARVQESALVTAWHRISTDNHNVDWDPKNGVVFSMNDATWAGAVEDLLEDIRSALPREQQRLRIAVADVVATTQTDVEADR